MIDMIRFPLVLAVTAVVFVAGCEQPPTSPDAPIDLRASFNAKGQERHTLCHLNGTGDYVKITVADAAYDMHMAHGDLPEGPGGECGLPPMSRLELHVAGGWMAVDVDTPEGTETCAAGTTCWYDVVTGSEIHLHESSYSYYEDGSLICGQEWGCRLVMDQDRVIYAEL